MNSLLHTTWRVIAVLAAAWGLTGCAPPPLFAEAPAAREGIALPALAAGLWAKEGKDEGSRARIVPTGRGTLRLEIFNTRPAEASEPPLPPLNGRTARFAGHDWLVLDVAAWDYGKSERGGMTGFLLLQYRFDNAARVCLQVPTAAAFAAAVSAGELTGKLKPDRNFQAVLVTSPASQWVDWWNQHRDSVEFSQDSLCLRRLEQIPVAAETAN